MLRCSDLRWLALKYWLHQVTLGKALNCSTSLLHFFFGTRTMTYRLAAAPQFFVFSFSRIKSHLLDCVPCKISRIITCADPARLTKPEIFLLYPSTKNI